MTTRSVDMNWKMRAIRVLPMFLLPALSSAAYSGFVSFTKICKCRELCNLHAYIVEATWHFSFLFYQSIQGFICILCVLLRLSLFNSNFNGSCHLCCNSKIWCHIVVLCMNDTVNSLQSERVMTPYSLEFLPFFLIFPNKLGWKSFKSGVFLPIIANQFHEKMPS